MKNKKSKNTQNKSSKKRHGGFKPLNEGYSPAPPPSTKKGYRPSGDSARPPRDTAPPAAPKGGSGESGK